MKLQHTPGPWTATLEPRINVKGRDKKSICAVVAAAGKVTRPYEEHCANANLIAAAPDMYRALDIARVYVSQQPNAEDVLREIEAAIAKVEGTPHSKSEAKRLNTLKGRK